LIRNDGNVHKDNVHNGNDHNRKDNGAHMDDGKRNKDNARNDDVRDDDGIHKDKYDRKNSGGNHDHDIDMGAYTHLLLFSPFHFMKSRRLRSLSSLKIGI